jgi:hypothetical protein
MHSERNAKTTGHEVEEEDDESRITRNDEWLYFVCFRIRIQHSVTWTFHVWPVQPCQYQTGRQSSHGWVEYHV